MRKYLLFAALILLIGCKTTEPVRNTLANDKPKFTPFKVVYDKFPSDAIDYRQWRLGYKQSPEECKFMGQDHIRRCRDRSGTGFKECKWVKTD